MLRDQVYPLSSRFKISIGHSITPILILPTAAAFSAERNSAVQVSERRLSPLYLMKCCRSDFGVTPIQSSVVHIPLARKGDFRVQAASVGSTAPCSPSQ